MNKLLNKLVEVNQHINDTLTYTPDDSRNHWQTLAESLNLQRGDCEDYACAKFHLLVKAGYNPCLAQVQTATGEQHMICMCDGYILDNITDIVADPQDRRDLTRPIFTLWLDCIECNGESLPVERSAKWVDWLKRSGLYEGG